MDISPDSTIYWQWEFVKLNATIVYTWAVMVVLLVFSLLATRKLRSDEHISPWQNALESIVAGMMGQIREVTRARSDPFLPFLGTLFLFIVTSNILSVVPGFATPTGSLSTTAALALCVFVAVPIYGIANIGLGRYLINYVKPSPIMLPFNIVGELSRTLALAVRLFGNIMSGTMIVAILLALAPILFPVLLQLLGLLTGVVQAYIFAMLAAVYIGANLRVQSEHGPENLPEPETSNQGD